MRNCSMMTAKILKHSNIRKKTTKLWFLGSENAGKTTLRLMLKDLSALEPTPQERSIYGRRLETFELGSQTRGWRVWKKHFHDVHAIVYVIDACDRTRFIESSSELESLLRDETLAHLPVLVFGNKMDDPSAASEEELSNTFGLNHLTTGKTEIPRSDLPRRPLEFFMCSSLEGRGYDEGFRWLSQYLD